jgi:Arc/MetJ-type ribon-helix-helix transcriptional regulator
MKASTSKVVYVPTEAHGVWAKVARLVRLGRVKSASAVVNEALAQWVERYEAEHGEIR